MASWREKIGTALPSMSVATAFSQPILLNA